SALYRGLALGLAINSVIAYIQHLGYAPVAVFPAGTFPSGLLFNSTALAAVSVLVTIACIQYGLWLYLLGILPSLYLTHSRGAYLILALTFLAKRSLLAALGGLLAAAAYYTYTLSDSDILRLTIWGAAISKP